MTALPRLKQPSVLPGFGLALGYTLVYLSLIVLLPLAALAWKTLELSPAQFWRVLSAPATTSALWLSFYTAFLAAAANAVLGLLVAWVLVRVPFPGRRLVDALVDLPFALPTAVAGIALTTIYGPTGWVGRWAEAAGVKIVYTPVGITLALVFIGLPFVVRTVQPVLQELGTDVEEAARSLGASSLQTFTRVVFPQLWPALLTGFALAFARGVGEYGSVVFISGNLPYRTQIAPLLIAQQLDQYQYAQATAIAVAMLALSFALLLVINLLQRWTAARGAA